MSNAIPTPRQTYTLKFTRNEIENIIIYIAEKLPTYKLLDNNKTLNSIRIQVTRAFQPQHLDIRFQESEGDSTTFEIEVSKFTGGMTNDDSNLYAKKNLDEFMTFLVKCLEGYKITEEDIKNLKKGQTKNMIFYLIFFVILIWFFFGGGLEMLI
tara:strand:+ start:126 stop:587 length:462 start_codon:yes stop_codon:yes gene_type:complete